jgi:Chitinase class I
MSVEIFTDANFSGTASGSIDQDSPYVGDVWNDKISSIEVGDILNVAHETGDLQYVEEQNTVNWPHYCDPNTYPCAQGKTYQGRGPIQLSWNYNYALCGEAIGIDLLNNPELVSTNSSISFMTALWFWMTPQSPKPSCHNAISTSGFGMTISIINGGIECGKGQVPEQAQHRIQRYQQFAGMLGVTPGENLFC